MTVLEIYLEILTLIFLKSCIRPWLCLVSWALSFPNSTVQIAMISKVMVKFRPKIYFQISLKFYRTVEKVETCDGNGQKS